jgi:exodeoxyribonuclease VII large subunit
MRVIAHGRVSVYESSGQYQLYVDDLQPDGAGSLAMRFEQLKRKLAAEGLFDEADKVPLPFFPTTIGVVTSPTGAALQDILNITRRRNPLVNVLVLPCSVQGSDAAKQIENQIRYANLHKLCDVLIVGRGGGSLEDLLPFSEENVVRAIAESAIPTVSAVGHEIDWAISDFAADRRAPTPSAAAEICTPLLSDITGYIQQVKNHLTQTIENKISNCKLLIKSFTPESLEMSFRTIEQPYLLRFDDLKEQILENIAEKTENYRKRIENAKIRIEAANPKLILARGYAMVRDKETGKIITKASSVKPGQVLEIVPESGTINVTVNSTTN